MKVERVGNLNYPEAARAQKLYGSLILTVAIKADGSIESIVIDKPSGKKILDAAAVRILELAAPYGNFPRQHQARHRHPAHHQDMDVCQRRRRHGVPDLALTWRVQARWLTRMHRGAGRRVHRRAGVVLRARASGTSTIRRARPRSWNTGWPRCARRIRDFPLQYTWVDYGRISIHLKRALIAAEDAKFVEHEGFDWNGHPGRAREEPETRQDRRRRLDDQPAAREEPVPVAIEELRAQGAGSADHADARMDAGQAADPRAVSERDRVGQRRVSARRPPRRNISEFMRRSFPPTRRPAWRRWRPIRASTNATRRAGLAEEARHHPRDGWQAPNYRKIPASTTTTERVS
jgi:TonB family protein